MDPPRSGLRGGTTKQSAQPTSLHLPTPLHSTVHPWLCEPRMLSSDSLYCLLVTTPIWKFQFLNDSWKIKIMRLANSTVKICSSQYNKWLFSSCFKRRYIGTTAIFSVEAWLRAFRKWIEGNCACHRPLCPPPPSPPFSYPSAVHAKQLISWHFYWSIFD